MTKEKALTEFLADKIFASGEEGFNAGWDAAMKQAQSQIVDVSPQEVYIPRQNGLTISRVSAQQQQAAHLHRVQQAEELLRQGHITSHEQFQKFIKGLD